MAIRRANQSLCQRRQASNSNVQKPLHQWPLHNGYRFPIAALGQTRQKGHHRAQSTTAFAHQPIQVGIPQIAWTSIRLEQVADGAARDASSPP